MPLVSFIHIFTFVCPTTIEEMTWYLTDCIQDEMKSLFQEDGASFLSEFRPKHCFTLTEFIELVRTISRFLSLSVSSNRCLLTPIRIQSNIFVN